MKPYIKVGKRPAKDNAKPNGPWNSLEIMKLVVAALTPVTLGVLAASVNFETSNAKLESDWWNRKVDKQIELWTVISDRVDELTHLGLEGDSLTAAQKDKIEEDYSFIRRKALLYSPFLNDDEKAGISKILVAVLEFEGHPDDKNGWALLQSQKNLEQELEFGLANASLRIETSHRERIEP